MNVKYLNIIIPGETSSFKELTHKVAYAFNVSLNLGNQDGRLVAKGNVGNYFISVIDRFDDLGTFLCDENFVLRIEVRYDDFLNYEEVENKIRSYLRSNNIEWTKGLWRPASSLQSLPKEIFP